MGTDAPDHFREPGNVTAGMVRDSAPPLGAEPSRRQEVGPEAELGPWPVETNPPGNGPPE